MSEVETRFWQVAEMCPDAICIHSGRQILYLNAAAVRLLGAQDAQDLLGRSPLELVDPEYHSLARERIRRVLEEEVVVDRVQYRWRRLDGVSVDVEVSCGPVMWEGALAVQTIARDISDRVRNEAKLHESQERLNLAIRSSGAVPWAFDLRTMRYTEWSTDVRELYGFSADALPDYETWLARLHPDDRERITHYFQGVTERVGDEWFEQEFRIVHPERGVRWLSSLGRCYFDDAGHVVRLAGVNFDITARKQTEEALRASEGKLRALFQALSEGVLFYNEQGELVEANYAVTRRQGIEPEALENPEHKIRHRIIWPDGTPCPVDEQPPFRALRTGKSVENVELGFRMRGGGILWKLMNAQPVYDDRGTLLGVVSSFIDITERKRAEEEIRRLNRQLSDRVTELETLLDILPVGVWQGDERCERIIGNRAAYEMMGLPQGVNGSITPPADLVREKRGLRFVRDGREIPPDQLPMQRAARSGLPVKNFEHEMVLEDGRVKTMLCNVSPLPDDNGRVRGVLAVYHDITELRQGERKLAALVERDRLLMDNTPLAVIEWDAEFCVRRWSGLAEDLFEWTAAETIGQSIDALHLVYEEDQEKVKDAKDALLDPANPYVISCNRNLTKTGKIISCVWYNSVLHDEAGQTLAILSLVLDVTESMRTEEALRQSEEKFRLAADAVNGLIYDLNYKTGLVDRTRGITEILGYSSDDIPVTTDWWMEQIHPDDRPDLVKRWRQIEQSSENSMLIEYRVRHRDGRWLHLEDRSVIMRDESGKPVRLVGCSMDVTERKQAEINLRDSEERFRQIFEHAGTGIIIGRLDGVVERVNPAFCSMIGHTKEELLGCHFKRLMPSEEVPIHLDGIRRLVAGEIPVFELESRYIHKSGYMIWVQKCLSVLSDEFGKPENVVVLVSDISRQKEVEEILKKFNAQLEQEVSQRTAELSERESRLRAILDNALSAILTVDFQGKIEEVNPAGVHLFGYTADEMVGQNIDMLLQELGHTGREHDKGSVQEPRFANLVGSSRELKARCKDGTIIDVAVFTSQVGHLGLYAFIFLDISRRKQLEREVVEIATLEQQRIGQDLHDDVGQELTALGLLSDSLVESLQEESSENALFAEKIERNIQRTLQKVRLMARGLAVYEIDPEKFLDALSMLVNRLSESSEIRCRFQVDPNISVSNTLQATQLYHIAQEACTNVLKHAEAGHLDVSLQSVDGALILRVRDDGKGIDYNREGLGLKIMRHRARVLGAALTVERVQPRGTLITCRLDEER